MARQQLSCHADTASSVFSGLERYVFDVSANFLLDDKRIDVLVSVTVLHLLAISSAVYRLRHRFRIRRAWWDDYVVFVPLALDVVYTPLFWVRFLHRGNYIGLYFKIIR